MNHPAGQVEPQGSFRRIGVWMLAAFACLLLLLAQGVQAQPKPFDKDFDHARTGFRLEGQHARERCESCHFEGVFRGTPRDCASCHTGGTQISRGNVTKPVNHFATPLGCDTCHNTNTFAGARFNHLGVTPGTCGTCHNGVVATGKTSNHMVTTTSCDVCHRSSGWVPASSFDHSGVQPGTCATCHNGSRAKGKHAAHVPEQLVSGIGNASCDACHKGGFASFQPAQVHSNFMVTGQCAVCHTGNFPPATGKPNTAVHAGVTQCESCHQTTGWQGAKVDHGPFNAATNCAVCHNGTTAAGKPSTHVPVGNTNCIGCHSKSGPGWKPASSWNHTQVAVAGQCNSCHTGGFPPADGMSSKHVPHTRITGVGNPSCDACHRSGFSAFTPGYFHAYFSVSAQCVTCHTGTYPGAVGRPNTPIHAGASTCENCHRTGSWRTATVDHGAFTAATNCASCHNGSTAAGKSATHIPVGAVNCVSCHNKEGPGWRPATYWNHTQVAVAGQCATCHSGGFPPADGRNATHIPYASVTGVGNPSCDSCHRSGYQSWAPGYFHSNFSVTAQCATCHTGGFQAAVGKPNTPVHAGVTACESCHKTSGWANASVDHASFNQGTNCTTCHNGTTATGKSPTHIPVAATNCVRCHNMAPSNWRPSLWNHTQMAVAGQCASCHTGAFPPADGKLPNHIPYASVSGVGNPSCDSCHKSGFQSWAPGYFHANFSVATQCASCHTGTFMAAVGKPNTAIHAGQTTCENCHKPGSWTGATVDHAPFNASTSCVSCHNGSTATGKSATHIPVASTNCIACHGKAPTPWKPASTWNHTQVTVAGQCASCHSGAFPPADGKVPNHIPYASVSAAASANCDRCHRSGFVNWAPGYFHANVSVTTQCATCHTGTYLAAVGKPNTPVHANATACESCHKTSGWSGASVDHTGYTSATICASCHNGATATGKPATHMPVGSTNCIACHSKAPGNWKPSLWNHTQVTVSGQCASCHSGAYPPADGKVANHVPYAGVSGIGNPSCEACHKAGFTSWAPGQVHKNFGSITTQCATCHTGTFLAAVGKPNTAIHANATACESCHNTTSWGGAAVDHSKFNATTNCASCHNGSTASGKPATHIPVGTTNCLSCHNKAPSSWKPSTWNHTQLAVTAQCATCHTGGFQPADGKPANHVPYSGITGVGNAQCDSCHKSGFTSWAPGYFHANVTVSAQCSSCHTGTFLAAVGKPSTPVHAGVTACENCHNTSRWTGAKVDHTPYNASTNCASCHNGSTATGKTNLHIPTTANCIACHAKSPTPWKPATYWNHTQATVAGQCATCHSGAYPPADGKVPNHVPYASVAASAGANCDRCHKSGYISWSPGYFHANVSVSNQCATCHTGTFLGAVGKPNTPIHAGVTACEGCHKTTGWTNASVDHSGYNASTNCASCHNGSTASGKPATHVPVGSTNCIACHNKAPSDWKPSLWNHTQVTVVNACASCHSGAFPPADGKVPNHIPYANVAASASANCDRCHKAGYVSWAPGRLHANVSVSTQCGTCHTGTYLSAVGKPNTAIHAGQTVCENCHKSTASWLSAAVDHSSYNAATNCASCHNGSTATGKPATHVPVGSTNCIACHNKAPNTWKPSLWNHTQVAVTAQCASCHTGAYQPADGKPTNHIPYATVPVAATANCDACHKAGYASWAPGYFHRYYSVSTACASCHSGSYLGARGKPNTPTHATVTVCETCHTSTTNWLTINFKHSPANAVGTGTCDTCHNGSTAKGKHSAHIPVTTGPTKCDSCHKSQVSFATSVTMNHTVVSATTCKTCHNGSYVSSNAQAKPSNHIPEATQLLNGASMDCKACHTSTTSWGTMKMNHNSSMGNGVGWCKGCHASGTNFLGSMEKKSLTHEKSSGVTDCSQSGCHRPLGNEGSTYTKWD